MSDAFHYFRAHAVRALCKARAMPLYLAKDDVYRCPAGEKLAHHFTADEDGQKMRVYLTKACRTCPLKDQCTTANERRIKRWEHEHVVEAAQTRLDQNPQAMRARRKPVEHPFANGGAEATEELSRSLKLDRHLERREPRCRSILGSVVSV